MKSIACPISVKSLSNVCPIGGQVRGLSSLCPSPVKSVPTLIVLGQRFDMNIQDLSSYCLLGNNLAQQFLNYNLDTFLTWNRFWDIICINHKKQYFSA